MGPNNGHEICPNCGAEDTVYEYRSDPVFKVTAKKCSACDGVVKPETDTRRVWVR